MSVTFFVPQIRVRHVSCMLLITPDLTCKQSRNLLRLLANIIRLDRIRGSATVTLTAVLEKLRNGLSPEKVALCAT
jgi:hypothetical protein